MHPIGVFLSILQLQEELKLANIKSAKKRARQNLKLRERNRYYKTTARTYIKRTRELIANGEFDKAEETIRLAEKALDKAAQKGIIHKNNAARRKSRLQIYLNRAKTQTA